MAECPSCGNPFPGDFDPRARAWCPRCGADIKQLPESRSARVEMRSEKLTAADGRLGYFHARFVSFWRFNRKVYRVDLTDSDFLFIHLGITTLQPEEEAQRRTLAAGGGLVGAAAGWAALQERHTLDKLQKLLANADEQILRQFAEEDEDSYIQPIDDLHDVRIDPRGFWSFLTCSPECRAFWRFRYGKSDEATLELLSIDDVSLAIAELTRVFKDRLQVNVKHDSL